MSSPSQTTPFSADDPIGHSYSDDFSSSEADMLVHGTPATKKGTTSHSRYEDTRQTSEVNRQSWAKEIEGKISVFDGAVDDFLDIFVPKPGSEYSEKPFDAKMKNAFKDINTEKGKEAEKYPSLVCCILAPEVKDLATEKCHIDKGPQETCSRVRHQDQASVC